MNMHICHLVAIIDHPLYSNMHIVKLLTTLYSMSSPENFSISVYLHHPYYFALNRVNQVSLVKFKKQEEEMKALFLFVLL